MTHVIFWGATGQARVLREALLNQASLVALFDNRAIASPFPDVPIYTGEEGFLQWQERASPSRQMHACVAIGGPHGRDRLARMEWLQDRGHAPLRVIHTTAFLAQDARLGDGCQILAMSAVCANAKLGRAVIINTKASVDHDCIIGDGVHIGPGATLAGQVTVNAFAFIGAGATILPGLSIGESAVIGAGAVVTRNIAAGQTVIGNPARPLIRISP